MELTSWLALAAICVMGAISPGPSLALIIRNTVQGGQGHGVATALGHGLGVGIYALVTALGLSILITQTPILFDLIRYGGAAFLAWLGVKALLAKPVSGEASEEVHQLPPSTPSWRPPSSPCSASLCGPIPAGARGAS